MLWIVAASSSRRHPGRPHIGAVFSNGDTQSPDIPLHARGVKLTDFIALIIELKPLTIIHHLFAQETLAAFPI